MHTLSKDFPVSYASQLYEKLEGSMPRAADPNQPEEYSLPQNILLSLQSGGADQEGPIAADGQDGQGSMGAEQLYWASFDFGGLFLSFSYYYKMFLHSNFWTVPSPCVLALYSSPLYATEEVSE